MSRKREREKVRPSDLKANYLIFYASWGMEFWKYWKDSDLMMA